MTADEARLKKRLSADPRVQDAMIAVLKNESTMSDMARAFDEGPQPGLVYIAARLGDFMKANAAMGVLLQAVEDAKQEYAVGIATSYVSRDNFNPDAGYSYVRVLVKTAHTLDGRHEWRQCAAPPLVQLQRGGAAVTNERLTEEQAWEAARIYAEQRNYPLEKK